MKKKKPREPKTPKSQLPKLRPRTGLIGCDAFRVFPK